MFYNPNDDQFYHGPAWVIKPRIYPLKEHDKQRQPGPGHYHIPDRSIYERPGITIGSKFETSLPIANQLLGFYFPKEQYKTRTVSITPRRNEYRQNQYSIPFYSPSKQTSHISTPRLLPNSYKNLSSTHKSTSPGPTAYPMYEFDEDILPRSKTGFTQKSRLSFDPNISIRKPNPPFYYPKTIDRHRLPSFSFGKRFQPSSKIHSSPLTFYSSYNSKNLCASIIKPGTTLKGRWSPFVRTFIPPSS